MANKKETAAKAAPATEVTADNIMDVIRAKNLMTDTALEAAVEQIAKDNDEDKKREAMHTIKRYEYKNARALIELRKRRAEDKITKEYLTKTKEVKDNFLSGKNTRVECDKMEREAEEAKRKAFQEMEKQYNDNVRELREAYPSYYSYEWDRCW